MVTRPALGILAAPTLAKVAVILQRKRERDYTTTTETAWGDTEGFDLLRG